MKRIILLAAVALAMLGCGEKQVVQAVVLEKHLQTQTMYMGVPAGKTIMIVPSVPYRYFKLYLDVIGTDCIVEKEMSIEDGVLLEVGDTITTTIRVK